MQRYKSIYQEITSLYRIKDPVLHFIADRLQQLNAFNPTTDFKAIKKLNDHKLLQALTKKTGKEFQISIGSRPFGLKDIIEFDKQSEQRTVIRGNEVVEMPSIATSLFSDSKVLSKITKNLSTWSGAQRYIKNLDNHVLQLNIDWEWLKEYVGGGAYFGEESYRNVDNYIKASNHPTSRTKLTLGWIRFTLLKPGYILEGGEWEDKDKWMQKVKDGDHQVTEEHLEKSAIQFGLIKAIIKEKICILDEIQTDMDDEQFLDKELMQGWDVFLMQKFVNFIRGSLKVRKIYMPTYESKQNLYSANPPMYLYKEIPNKFGFKKDSDMKGFMLLENTEK